jgi:hypothetical protein
MKPPERIYLQVEDDDGNIGDVGDGTTWCVDSINESDIPYVKAPVWQHGEPPRSGLFLVTYISNGIRLVLPLLYDDGVWRLPNTEESFWSKVVSWMPLPEPEAKE